MPWTRVVLFREDDGSCPLLEWMDQLAPKAQAKCLSRLERLQEKGHELRRPEADYLRDGVHASLRGVNHRILYFFHGNAAVVVSHGLVKKQAVPPAEIDRAIDRKRRFEADPARHTLEEA